MVSLPPFPPRLILGHEPYDEFLDERGRLVPKVGGSGKQQFLHILKSKL